MKITYLISKKNCENCRLELFEGSKSFAIRLESLLRFDKSCFWSKISSYRRNSKKRATVASNRPSPRDFIEFYGKLFSHHDRESTAKHVDIENKERERFNFLKTENFSLDCSRKFISEWIECLKIKKASGSDGICNEMVKYALCPSLCNILKYFYENIFFLGYIPCDLNCAIIKPIPKKGEIKDPSDFNFLCFFYYFGSFNS